VYNIGSCLKIKKMEGRKEKERKEER